MKKIILLTACLLSTMYAQEIDIEISGIKNNKGEIYIGLYNSPQGFTKIESTYSKVILRAEAGVVRYRFTDIPSGRYAISVFHDENSNGKIDKSLVGLPKEGYGFSNNKRFMLRGSTFDEASFTANRNTKIDIKMGY